MITINLLSGRWMPQHKRNQKLRKHVTVVILTLLMTLVGSMALAWSLEKKFVALKQDQIDKQAYLASLREKTKQGKELEQNVLLLDENNSLVDRLMDRRLDTIQLLDAVSQSLEKLDIWLLELHQHDVFVAIEGLALNKEEILQFADGLRQADLFDRSKIVEARVEEKQAEGVYHFTLEFQVRSENGKHEIRS